MSSLILNIETSGKTCSVALGKDGMLLDLEESHPSGYEHAEKLNLFILDILKRNSLTTQDLGAVCISAGPGSYTGLRIGTSTAKGLCYALGIPLISLNSLEIMMEVYKNTNLPLADVNIPMIDARRMEVYQARFDRLGNCISPPQASVIEQETFENMACSVLLFGDGADKLTTFDWNKKIHIHSGFKTSASGMVKLAELKFIRQKFEDVAYFDPLYLKEFQS